MADVAPAPRHPAPTPADATTYAPYAVMAVIALVVAILYAAVLGVLAVIAFTSHQPFIQPLMLIFPVATLVLTFAARRQIQNSEGARAGMGLVNAAWWIAVLGGVGYLTYLVAYQLGVRKDAADSFRAWGKNLNEVDLSDPKNPAFFYVFDGVLDSEQQGKLKIGQADVLYRQKKTQVAYIRQSFPVRLANRNRGAMEFAVGGLDDWSQDASGAEKGQLAVTAKCPEGEFVMNFPMHSKRIDGLRKWQIGVTPTGNLSSARLTRYGQPVRDLEQSGYALVHDTFLPAVISQAENPILLPLFAEPQKQSYPLFASVIRRMAVGGGPVWQRPEPPNYTELINKFFDPVEKGDAVREAEQRRAFATAWRGGRLFPAGRYIRSSQDQQPIMFVEKNAFELKVPIEVQPPGAEITGSAARAAVVLRCEDPALVAKANELRAAAAGDALTDPSNNFPAPGSIPWRLIRIESDMKPVATERDPSQVVTAPTL